MSKIKVGFIGLGLMGGSLAKALKAQTAVGEVVATGRRAESLERGLQLGVIDSYTLDMAEAVAGADVVVIATPTLVKANIQKRELLVMENSQKD